MTLESLSAAEFLAREWELPEPIMGDWLPTSGICMIFGPRGGGKTFVTLGIALHVAAGWRFLDMDVPKPRKVLYVDGEMNAGDVAKRIRKLDHGMGPFPAWTFENLWVLTHQIFELGIPDLSEPGAGRRLIERNAVGMDLIVLDNLSCLIKSGDENASESWHSISEWLLSFRRSHQTVLCVHHTGKPNAKGQVIQRGTSKREDAMNSSVKLVTTSYGPPLSINWEYTKVRSWTPDPATFDLKIRFAKDSQGKENSARIEVAESPLDEALRVQQIQAMQAEGRSLREIADETGVSYSTVRRRVKRTTVSC